MDVLNNLKIDKIQHKDNDVVRMYLKSKEDIFIAIRSLMFGQEISKEYKDIIKQLFGDSNLRDAFKRSISPEITDESGLPRLTDRWSQLVEVETITGSSPETIRQLVSSSKMLVGMCDKALNLLVNPDGDKVVLDFDFEKSLEEDPYGVAIIARNMFIRHINTKLNHLRVIADTSQKDLDDYVSNLKKNSNK
jgi:ERCC4-related helicase